MSIESELQKTIEQTIERAMEVKGRNYPIGLPVLALLVGAPLIKSREATLIDSLLGSDEKIREKFETTLRTIRFALAGPEMITKSKQLISAMDAAARPGA